MTYKTLLLLNTTNKTDGQYLLGEAIRKYADYDKPITLKDIEVLRSIGRKSVNKFTSEDIVKAQKWAYKFYQQLGVKSPFFRAWFGDWRAYDNDKVKFKSNIQLLSLENAEQTKEYFSKGLKDKTLYRGDVENVDTGYIINVGVQVYNDTVTYANRELLRSKNVENYQARLSILNNIKNIVENSILLDTEIAFKDNSKNQNMYQSFCHKFYTLAKIQEEYYLVKLTVDELNSESTIRRAYNVNDIKISPVAVSQVYEPADTTDDNGDLLSTISISNLHEIVKQYDKSFNPKLVNERLIENGMPKKLYHQTETLFTEFDIKHKGAGTSDLETPFGIFLKESNKDIGLKGKEQMQLYAKMANPLIVKDRTEIVKRICELSSEYTELYNKSKEIDKEYSKKHEDAIKAFNDFIIQNSQSPNRKSRQELYEDPEFIKVFEAEDNIVDEWQEVNRENDLKAKEALTRALKENGFDGVILENDVGSFGRSTEAYIVLDNTQVKSATDNIGTFDKTEGDIQYSLADGTPSPELENAIERLNNDENVSNEELESIPQIEKLLDEVAKRPETYTIDTPERKTIRKKVLKKLLSLGSAQVDNKGKIVYNGVVKKERRADIVIGLSAAGKSSVFVDPLSYIYSSRVIDSDMAKEQLPEFDNGIGANAVHRESQDIIDDLLELATYKGENIVWPVVGGNNPQSTIKKIEYLKDNGYSVYLHLNELSNNKAVARSLNRYIETERFIPPAIIKKYGDTPTKNFNTIINMEGLVDGYSHYSNDVARGEEPKLIEVSENVREFDERRSELGEAQKEKKRTIKTTEYKQVKADPTDGPAYSLPKAQYSIPDIAKGKSNTELEALVKDGTITLDDAFEELVAQHGIIKPGERAKVDVTMPNKISKKQNVMRFVRTAAESGHLDEGMRDDQRKELLKGAMTYQVISDKAAVQKADDSVRDDFAGAVQKWQDIINSGKQMTKFDIALGERLLQQAAENGHASDVIKYTAELAELGTRMGQNIQALHLLKQITGIGQLYYVQRMIDKPIYIKGVSFTTASHDRMYFFSDKETRVAPGINNGTTGLAAYFTIEQLGTDYCKLTPISGSGLPASAQWVRMSFTTGTPSSVIITVNELIE